MEFSISEVLPKWFNQFTVNDVHGQNRLVYNEQWIKNQQNLITLGCQLGATSSVDLVGNVCLEFSGQTDHTNPIMTGSHMDTVAMGGKYDGLYGILGGLCAIQQTIAKYGSPHKPLRLISFSEEEGSRFPTAFTGSRYFTQHTTPTNIVDATGQSFDIARQNALKKLKPLSDHYIPYFSQAQTFTELHIEQGPRLENTHQSIGLVKGIVAQQRFTVTVSGLANHAGTTPMNNREDAVEEGCRLINKIYQLAHHNDPNLLLTIGRLIVTPNVSNVIANQVQFSIDIRHHVDLQLEQFVSQLLKLVTLQQNTTIINVLRVPSTLLSPSMLKMHQEQTQRLGLSYLPLFSGAGHDSQIISQVTPTAMIFVPSQHGISHRSDESTVLQDLVTGTRLLAASLHAQAY